MDGSNTHPFTAEIDDRRWVFAHNGTVRAVKDWPLKGPVPAGDTDSEHAFCYLLHEIKDCREEDLSKKIKSIADKMRQVGNFNFLLSDGNTLWAYADQSLYYTERIPPHGGELVRLKDDGYSISLGEVKAPNERAILFATKPLSDENWTQMSPGELIAVSNGYIVGRY
jgi:glutamine amidotransferase